MLPKHPVSSKVADEGSAGHQCQGVPGSPSYPVSTDTKHRKPQVPICIWERLRRQAGREKPRPAAWPAPASLSRCGTKFLGIRCPGHSQEATGAVDNAPVVQKRPCFHSPQPLVLGPTSWPQDFAGQWESPGWQRWADQLLPQGHQNPASSQPRWAGSGVGLWQQLSPTGQMDYLLYFSGPLRAHLSHTLTSASYQGRELWEIRKSPPIHPERTLCKPKCK